MTAASEALLFHGTTRECLLAETEKNTALCVSTHCYLCNILRESFDVSKCGKLSE